MLVKLSFKLTHLQINLISLFLVSTWIAALLIITIGYRETRFGLLALGGIAGLVVAVTIFKWPQIGVYLLVISVFTNASTILTDQGLPGINKPLTALVFLTIMVKRFSARTPLLPLRGAERFFLAYGGVWLASIVVAKDQAIVIDRVIDFIKDFAILLCVVYVLSERPDGWKRLIWLIIISAGVLAGLGAYQALTGNTHQTFFGFSKYVIAQIVEGSEDSGRLNGPLDDPNFWGQTLVSILPLALYRLLDEQKIILKIIAALSALFIALAILNTYSRGAFMAMMLVLLLVAIERRIKFSLIVSIIPAVFLIMQFLPAGFTDRLQTLSIFTNEDSNVQSEVSFRGRSSEMMSGLNMFADHPFLGVGVGNYIQHYQKYASRLGLEYRTEGRRAHSTYLEIAAETGLPGLITFGGLFLSVFLNLAQTRRKLRILPDYPRWSTWISGLQIGISAYLFTSTFLHGDYIRYLWLLVTLSVALFHLADHLVVNQKTIQTRSIPWSGSQTQPTTSWMGY
ncbi:MAG: O-antigen ligase family protein [Anaerolineae bacterium]